MHRCNCRRCPHVIVAGQCGFALLAHWAVDELKPTLRGAIEEPLVDTARILACAAALSIGPTGIDLGALDRAVKEAARQSYIATIHGFRKTTTDLRVVVTDARGTVILDSWDSRDLGRDFSRMTDVARTLAGAYGARTSKDLPDQPETSVMYVAAPIVHEGRIAGVLTVGKPTQNVNLFVASARARMVWGTTGVAASVVAIAVFVVVMVTRPVQRLTQHVRAARDGARRPLPAGGPAEVEELGRAFEEMRAALDGKRAIEQYVQVLTHEIKSPLAAIAGAAELLREEMPADRRSRFLDNIDGEVRRIGAVVERLLLLSSVEARPAIERTEVVDLGAMAREVLDAFSGPLERKGIAARLCADGAPELEGDGFLLRHALVNLVANAADFTPAGGRIDVAVRTGDRGSVVLEVEDTGTGIPEYALPRVFERFFSLERPDGGRKSSGLGLSLVQEVARLHGGDVELANRSGGGTRARLLVRTRAR
jgi:two-component system sensor histidine kinase CreC